MKRIVVILFFLPMLILSSGYSQSLNDLDIKNGFRHFKFGTSPSQIKNIVKQANHTSQNSNVTYYNYVGSDIDYVFFVKVYEIQLGFFNNKLFSIRIDFGNFEQKKDFSASEYNSLLSALENAYSTNWVKLTNNDKDVVFFNGVAWDAKNVCLELTRIKINYLGWIGGYILVFDKKLNNVVITSEF